MDNRESRIEFMPASILSQFRTLPLGNALFPLLQPCSAQLTCWQQTGLNLICKSHVVLGVILCVLNHFIQFDHQLKISCHP